MDVLEHVLKTYCNVEAFEMVDRLRQLIKRSPGDERWQQLKQELDAHIAEKSISPAQLEEWTGADCETPAEAANWLSELRDEIFDEPA